MPPPRPAGATAPRAGPFARRQIAKYVFTCAGRAGGRDGGRLLASVDRRSHVREWRARRPFCVLCETAVLCARRGSLVWALPGPHFSYRCTGGRPARGEDEGQENEGGAVTAGKRVTWPVAGVEVQWRPTVLLVLVGNH